MRLEQRIGRTLVVIAAMLFVGGCNTSVDDALKAKAERTVELTHPLGADSALDVSTTSGSIRVTGHQSDNVRVVATIVARAATREQARELAEQVSVQFGHAAEGTRIKTDRPLAASRQAVSVSYEIHVPQRTEIACNSDSGPIKLTDLIADVSGRTVSGSVAAARVAGSVHLYSSSGAIQCDQIDRGDIRLESISGGIRLADASTIGTCHMNSASGRLAARHIDAESIRMGTASSSLNVTHASTEVINLRSTSGKVTAKDISCARLQAESTSGDVSVTFAPDAPGNVAAGARSGSGAVSIVMPKDFAGQVDLRASSGSVRMSQPVAVRNKPARNHISGTIGDGSGSLFVRSGSGSIRVR